MTNEARRIDLGRVSPAAFSMLAAELMVPSKLVR